MSKAYLIVFLLCIAACSKKENPLAPSADMSAVRLNLAFTCTHEADHLPPLDPKVDSVFLYARDLEKRDGPKDFNEVARYYRIAAAYGHYKANHNLQLLVSQGLASSPDPEKESVDLAEQLVKADIPSGYYDIGHYLLQGYGLKQDEDAARRYIRKAADLGNPDAQYYVANLLNPADMAPDIARQMFQCAANQGHAGAGNDLGVIFQINNQFTEATESFQKSVEAGNSQSALLLQQAFDIKGGKDPVYDLHVQPDPERSHRYDLVEQFLENNDGRNPKVPDIDKIVPLPPAKLPPWDGTFQWQKEQDAAAAPQKPSDELIDQLAKAKNLDPATGLPLAGLSSKTSAEDQPATLAARLPIGTLAATGEQCPEDGVWCAKLTNGQAGDTQRRFLKGDVLPSVVVHEPRKVALLDQVLGLRQQTARVQWELIGYIDQA
jgi:hypothetical protein